MGKLVVLILAGDIEKGDEILVPLTMPPTTVYVWKVERDAVNNLVILSLMEGDHNWQQSLQKRDLVPVVR